MPLQHIVRFLFSCSLLSTAYVSFLVLDYVFFNSHIAIVLIHSLALSRLTLSKILLVEISDVCQANIIK